jgi:hypothetical protein
MPLGYISNPDPPRDGMHLSEDHHHQAKTGEEEDTSEIDSYFIVQDLISRSRT